MIAEKRDEARDWIVNCAAVAPREELAAISGSVPERQRGHFNFLTWPFFLTQWFVADHVLGQSINHKAADDDQTSDAARQQPPKSIDDEDLGARPESADSEEPAAVPPSSVRTSPPQSRTEDNPATETPKASGENDSPETNAVVVNGGAAATGSGKGLTPNSSDAAVSSSEESEPDAPPVGSGTPYWFLSSNDTLAATADSVIDPVLGERAILGSALDSTLDDVGEPFSALTGIVGERAAPSHEFADLVLALPLSVSTNVENGSHPITLPLAQAIPQTVELATHAVSRAAKIGEEVSVLGDADGSVVPDVSIEALVGIPSDVFSSLPLEVVPQADEVMGSNISSIAAVGATASAAPALHQTLHTATDTIEMVAGSLTHPEFAAEVAQPAFLVASPQIAGGLRGEIGEQLASTPNSQPLVAGGAVSFASQIPADDLFHDGRYTDYAVEMQSTETPPGAPERVIPQLADTGFDQEQFHEERGATISDEQPDVVVLPGTLDELALRPGDTLL